jgi:cytochrome c-type biogenesis protein CcmH
VIDALAFLFLGFFALSLMLYPLRRSWFALFIAALLLLPSLFLTYQHWGAWTAWQESRGQQANKARVAALLREIKSPAELITRLKAKLQENPESARGWYLLGRLYASQGKWGLAKDAFLRAYQLKPKDELIIVNYAQSLWQLNQPFRDLVTALLQRNPTQPDALMMLALDAYKQGDKDQAIYYWQRLLRLVPKRSKEAQMLRKAIAKAQSSESIKGDRSTVIEGN